jgi:MYXO-CTERM domain-containing protein
MIVALLVLALAAPAAAHVTVIPDVARPGDTVELTFRVPNERADATTVGLDLFLPPGVPATIADHPGWSTTDRGNGEIAFAADDPSAAIRPGRAQDFKVTLGPLPRTDRVIFKALQRYADGQVVRWIQTSGDERPAATLDLSGDDDGDGGAPPPWALIAGAVAVLAVGALFLRRR